MKNSFQYGRLHLAAFLLLGLLSFSACKKDPVNPTDNGSGNLSLHLHTYLENNEVDTYDAVYTTDAGREISLSLAQLYLSHIQLIKSDGSVYDLTDKKVFKTLEQDVFSMGDVPAGEYKSVRFRVGFDATDNQKPASSNAALLDHSEMWFGAAPQPDGYVFVHVKGTVDPTPDASGTTAQMQPFEYKLGTSSNYLQINLPEKPFTVVKDQVNFLHLVADYAALFDGIELDQPVNRSVLTAADNAIMPGTWLTINLDRMFRYEDE